MEASLIKSTSSLPGGSITAQHRPRGPAQTFAQLVSNSFSAGEGEQEYVTSTIVKTEGEGSSDASEVVKELPQSVLDYLQEDNGSLSSLVLTAQDVELLQIEKLPPDLENSGFYVSSEEDTGKIIAESDVLIQTSEEKVMPRDIQSLLIHIKELLQQAGTDSVSAYGGIAKKLLQSLELLTQQSKLQEPAVWKKVETLEGDRALRDVIKWYQSRTSMPNAAYHSQSQVTAKDMSKWLKQAINKYNLNELSGTQPGSVSAGPLSKVEQFMIRLDQNQSSEGVQKQLMHAFERAIKSSNLQHLKSGAMEMQLKLKPGNLGDVVVKMTQLNGEMAVKILVTSQSAKEMLEGNIQQLRHMFSPQQVVIEKSDMHPGQQQFQSKEQSFSGQERDSHSKHPSGEQNSDGSKEEDKESFHDILVNEKV
ncbi:MULTISPECIES: flagellar hook-length control protein FliK [Thalassobacillus]|uniref:flagellar hook-length control protein FliK n=1 Tax=Thalassobacillus TaxID=331971 RepID=UPI000A1C9347|nr:flagellar hook-length control protein FliK [Thalassobacillus devorans]